MLVTERKTCDCTNRKEDVIVSYFKGDYTIGFIMMFDTAMFLLSFDTDYIG